MTQESRDTTPASQWRSRKYLRFSDEQIVELALNPLPDNDRYYLEQEIHYRHLDGAVAAARNDAARAARRAKAWWRYLPMLFGLGFLVKQLLDFFR